jgi:hypothetical protein
VGEIKSTLDLVMEKTKGLTLSEEEKQQRMRQEYKDLLRGLLQKYQDRKLNLEQTRKEFEKLKKRGEGIDSAMVLETFGRIQPGEDNPPLISLLREFFQMYVSRLESILKNYERSIRSAAENRAAEVGKDLSQIHFVNGSAVVPNLEADGDWADMKAAIRLEHVDLLDREKAALRGRDST